MVLPSGIWSTRRIRATVPTVLISSGPGFSTLSSFWETTPMTLEPLLASLIKLMDLSLPAVIGITTPGNKTVLRSGNKGKVSGRLSLFICSSSSGVNNGINSASSSNPCRSILSNLVIFISPISSFRSFCHNRPTTRIFVQHQQLHKSLKINVYSDFQA